MRDFARPGLLVLFCGILAAQSSDVPHYEFADVHVSPKVSNDNMRIAQINKGRLIIRGAPMINLLSGAYLIDAEHILGGPNWLELDRYDVIAKVPAGSTLEAQGPFLRELLKERFKLVATEEMRPIPTWALSATGKKPQMKEADGTGETGCKSKTGGGGPGDGGFTVQFSCRNMTMAAFAASLPSMPGVQMNAGYFNPVVLDKTDLKGTWNFDVKWSLPVFGPAVNASDQVSVVQALDKQLGLKLEEVPVPTKVVVVESVERKPMDNPPGTSEALPPLVAPTEFDVADVKLSEPTPGTRIGLRMQPGGRFVAEGLPMRLLLTRAFNVNTNDSIAGIPSWADSVRVSITAKVGDYPGDGPTGTDPEFLAPLLRSLLKDRFGLEWHTEQRQATAYSLTAAKPKLKQADPNSRIFCKNAPPSPGRAPGEQVLNCQNAPMSLFAERLQIIPGINAPVEDATGLAGAWDFSFSFNPITQLMLNAQGRGGAPGAGGATAASDPIGGYTIFESLEKQLGLKLEAKKKTVPVIVIDKLSQKPTEN